MSWIDRLNNQYSGEQTTPTAGSWVERLNSSALVQAEEEERKRKEALIAKQQQAVQEFQAKQEELRRKAEEGNILEKGQAIWQGIKQGIGRGETLPRIEGATPQYQAQVSAQEAEKASKGNLLGRAGNAIAGFFTNKAEQIKQSEQERGKLGTIVEAGKGAVKNIGELASGVGKTALEFAPLTGMSGIRKIARFVGGKKVEDYLDRNTPEYQKAVDAFVDNNGILNYKANYSNEIQKTGGEVAEIGSWFIPITRAGKVAKVEQALGKALKEIPQVSRIIGASPKVVNVGGKLMYEVSKDVVDVAILDAIRGKDWETIKEDAKMAGIGGGVLRGAGEVVGQALSKVKGSRIASNIEKVITDMTPEEKTLARQLADEGKAVDDIATDIFAKREQEGQDIFKEVTETKPIDGVPEAPEAPKFTQETPKSETGTKTPSKEESPLIQEAKKYKSAEEFVKDAEKTKKVVQMNTEVVDKFKEFDRAIEPRWGEDEFQLASNLKFLKDDIAKNGIREPIIIKFNPENKRAIILEGNHRLQVAKELGIKKIPVKFIESYGVSDVKGSKFELTDIWNKANKSQPIQEGTVKTKTTAEPELKKQSNFAKRLNEELPENLKINEEYDVANIKGEVDKAEKLINKDKGEALKIALGSKKADANTQTATSIMLAEKAKQDGDWETVAQLYNNRRIANTRRGQEIAMEKASIKLNPEEEYMKQVVESRLKGVKLGSEDIADALKRKPKSERVMERVKKQKEDFKKELSNSVKLEKAQKVFNDLICK